MTDMRDIGPDNYGRHVFVDERQAPLIRYKVVDPNTGVLVLTVEKDQSCPMWEALGVVNAHAPAGWSPEG